MATLFTPTAKPGTRALALRLNAWAGAMVLMLSRAGI